MFTFSFIIKQLVVLLSGVSFDQAFRVLQRNTWITARCDMSKIRIRITIAEMRGYAWSK